VTAADHDGLGKIGAGVLQRRYRTGLKDCVGIDDQESRAFRLRHTQIHPG
jgi:hypothetical protein